jgi:6-pyruvoyl-tetrahydropterin synthase
MISLPNPTNKMTEMTPDFSTVVENYARHIIDGMDYKTLEQFAFDTLVHDLTKDYETVEELIEEIRDQYDEEVANDLLGN